MSKTFKYNILGFVLAGASSLNSFSTYTHHTDIDTVMSIWITTLAFISFVLADYFEAKP